MLCSGAMGLTTRQGTAGKTVWTLDVQFCSRLVKSQHEKVSISCTGWFPSLRADTN